MKKSDTLQEAFLAELEQEASKNTTKGGSNMGSQQRKRKDKKKSKSKKKNKSQKKPNNLKASHELYVTEEESDEEDDDPNAEKLNPEEENLKLKEEFEAEERMLPEKLKKLNMFEGEAKAEAEAKLKQPPKDNKVPDHLSHPPCPPPSQQRGGSRRHGSRGKRK